MSKFAPFDISTYTFKVVDNHEIKVDVFIPKSVKPGARPVIFRIHGGYLVTGARDFAPWTSQWLIDLAVQESAIIVSGDYRLLPESNGLDVLNDLNDLYEWVVTKLPGTVSEKTDGLSTADLDRILITGDSAGGYCALQMGLSQSSRQTYAPRAVISIYPVIGLDIPFFSKPHTDDEIPPMWASPSKEFVEAHIASIKPGTIISYSTPPLREELTRGIVFRGFLPSVLTKGVDPDKQYLLFPEERVKAGTKIAPLFLFHGKEDSGVPVEVSVNFVKLLRETAPDVPVQFVTPPGDHGFDSTATLDDDWLRDGIAFVKKWW